MIPVRFGRGGSVIGQVTKLIVDNEGVLVYIELTDEGKQCMSVSGIVAMRDFSFNSEVPSNALCLVGRVRAMLRYCSYPRFNGSIDSVVSSLVRVNPRSRHYLRDHIRPL